MKPGVSNVSLKQNDKARNGSQKTHRKSQNTRKTLSKTMFIIVFDARGIINKEFVPTAKQLQIARYGQVPCPGAKSTSCSSTTRAISYKLVLAVLPKLTNSKSGLQSDPQEPIQSSRYR
ncbi:hypothetical protein TNCV_184721 [Trichonephila clavipes]|nr:hypothetical protein TNCV_184721 [Trichonephila clavipes]